MLDSTLLPVLAAWMCLAPDTTSPPATWTQWRGAERDGLVAGPTWPDRLTDAVEVRWRISELGPSYSGPVVAADRVFTTETVDETWEVVRAFDRQTGRQLWQTRWNGAMKVPFFAAKNGSWIRATPALDGDRLYVAGMRDVLVCLDASTGETHWTTDFAERCKSPVPAFGFVCSPLVDGEFVYAQAGGGLVKLDKRTGDLLWHGVADGGGVNSAFSSPVIAEIGGRRQLVVQTRQSLCGVDPDSAQVLWERPIKSFRGMNILTPTIVGDHVFTAAYGGRAHLLEVTPVDDAVAMRAEETWQVGVQGYMSSPIVRDGHVYLFTRSNRLTCLRLSDGEKRWTSGPTGDTYWSLVAHGDRILALSDAGTLRLIRANPEAYEVIDELEVSETPTWAHLAVAGPDLFIRAQDALVALRWQEQTP